MSIWRVKSSWVVSNNVTGFCGHAIVFAFVQVKNYAALIPEDLVKANHV